MINKGPIKFFELTPTIIFLELFSLILIITICFYIYIKTREYYQLTKHQGIKFFRNGFLFLGLSAFMNLSHTLIILLKINRLLGIRMGFLFIIGSIFGIIGLIYLLFSLFDSKTKTKIKKYLLVIISTILILIYINKYYIMIIHGITLIMITILMYINYKKKSKKFISKIFLIYSLLLIFWFFNSLRFWVSVNLIYSREIIAIINGIIFIYIFLIFQKKFLK